MFNPVSTYRIQFHSGFTFRDFDLTIPYLAELGVSTIYASPVFEAVPGSTHGYDAVNPERINPEIGTLQELKAIAKKLKKLNISWIQDIVPNHMSFHPSNPWLMDVMKKGTSSKYAAFFDINWSGDKNSPLMVPFLGRSLKETIANGELSLVSKENNFYIKYFETEWPINAKVTADMPLAEVLDAQYYRLCHYEETNYQINYRRFFTVNSLICLNMQNPDVFDAYHKFIGKLLKQGIFQGLRVDHIDGLYDPEGYLQRLRQLAGPETYIVIEKILEERERLPSSWPVQGNTGYDFLAILNNLFTDATAQKGLTKYYEHLTGDHKEIQQQIIDKKRVILEDYMSGELNNLCQLFADLDLVNAGELQKLPKDSLKSAIAAFLIHCPVYRYYGHDLPLKGANKNGVKALFKKIGSRGNISPAVELLEGVFFAEPGKAGDAYIKRATVFYLRCMQFSGPLMAKGVEDTLMYTYNRFLGHNDVGDSPGSFGISKADFHKKMVERQRIWPLSLNGTSSHDTKRGEDVRARLNVLTNRSEEWIKAVEHWRILNSSLPSIIDANDEYFIYQTLTGSYPMPGAGEENYDIRLQEYLEKALREGKVNSSWSDPDIGYEQTVKDFVAELLDKTNPFWKSFTDFHREIADFGIINSLSQLLLKFTCPGIPDVYQGTELWDLSLVDPDNRRAVDYKLRDKWMEDFYASKPTLPELWDNRYSGKIKLYLQHILFTQRKANKELFTSGDYIPLDIKGKYAKHVFAFARRYRQEWFITAIPLDLGDPGLKSQKNACNFEWKDTRIILPPESPSEWENVFSGDKGKQKDCCLKVEHIFKGLPLAFLKMKQPLSERGAGVLLHITSLPSVYGIGDMGPAAEQFLTFLSRSRQKYWQLLPLNPIGADQVYSPYCSISSLAGNALLISPDLLAEEGLLNEKYLKQHRLHLKDELDFDFAEKLKNDFLDKAYYNFVLLKGSDQHVQFAGFCKREAAWLDDFALYVVLKAYHQAAPWYKWEARYKTREAKALALFSAARDKELTRIKWQQFVFFKQWARLKHLAGIAGIQLYGDLPFYVGHDSADVWANNEIFTVDKEGGLTGLAGVPPDYFNANGQLWGMPVYRWDVLKATNYEWWRRRICKNMELYDLIRLDHFRAFYDYWEVPAGAADAINGAWKPGPGTEFFTVLRDELPMLPLIAEDLGKVNAEVHLLRDALGLPGMKVLQFAFGSDMADSEHIPHCYASSNFVVYTGTHDNDTCLGWYEQADKATKRRLERYVGHNVNKRNIHSTLGRLAYATVAKMVILPMQDILGLGAKSRMNTPASVKGNWTWRMKMQPGLKVETQLRAWTEVYGRA